MKKFFLTFSVVLVLCSPLRAKIADPATAWTLDIPEAVQWMGLVGDKLLLRSERKITCLNPANGSTLWVKESLTPVQFIERCNDNVFLRTETESLTKLRLSDGFEEWTLQSFPGSRIFACSQTNAFGYSDQGMASLELSTGRRIWVTGVPGMSNRPVRIPGHLYASDKVAVHEFDENTGRKLRSIDILPPKYIAETSSATNLFLVVDADKITALNNSDFSGVWQKPAGGLVSTTPKTSLDAVFFGTQDGALVARRLKDGSKKWEVFAGAPIYFSPEIASDAVYFADSSGKVYAVDQDGKELWQKPFGALVAAPVYFRGMLYVLAKDGRLTAIADTPQLKKSK